MTRERVFSISSINSSSVVGFHPHDVTAVTFDDDGGAGTMVSFGYVVCVHASKPDVVSHQVNSYAIKTTFYVYTDQIYAVPGTDERAGGSVVVTAGVGYNLVEHDYVVFAVRC